MNNEPEDRSVPLDFEEVEDNPDECGSCGGDIGPSETYPWHLDSEDCRAIREPGEAVMTTNEPEDRIIAMAPEGELVEVMKLLDLSKVLPPFIEQILSENVEFPAFTASSIKQDGIFFQSVPTFGDHETKVVAFSVATVAALHHTGEPQVAMVFDSWYREVVGESDGLKPSEAPDRKSAIWLGISTNEYPVPVVRCWSLPYERNEDTGELTSVGEWVDQSEKMSDGWMMRMLSSVFEFMIDAPHEVTTLLATARATGILDEGFARMFDEEEADV